MGLPRSPCFQNSKDFRESEDFWDSAGHGTARVTAWPGRAGLNQMNVMCRDVIIAVIDGISALLSRRSL